MKKIVLPGLMLFMCAILVSSCSKRQYVCTCTTNLVTTDHMSGIYRSKKDAKNWCKTYERDTTTCEISN